MDFREITEKDIDIIYEWVNDPTTREQSYSDGKIKYSEHKEWFKDKLHSEECHFLIFFNNNKKIGLVRFDLKDDHWVVSINVAPSERGQGYSVKMLKKASKYLREKDQRAVYAYIKQQNIPSLKAFERAGYLRKEKIIYKGTESYLYIWK